MCFSEDTELSLSLCSFKADSLIRVLALSSARQKYVRQAWQKADINTKWAATRWAKKIEAREKVMTTVIRIWSFLFSGVGR